MRSSGTGAACIAGNEDGNWPVSGSFTHVRTVFFDAGNTLLGPYPSFVGRFLAVTQGHGEVLDARLVTAALTRVSVAVMWPMDWSDAALQREFWRQYYLRVLSEIALTATSSSLAHDASWREELAESLCRSFGDPGAYRLYPDTRSVLDRLASRGYRLGLISNFEPWLLAVLEREGVANHFSSTVISGIEGVAKPMPEMFHRALERAGADAASSLHVGDHVVEDIQAARAVGMSAVLIDRANRPEARSSARALEVPVLADLDGLVALLDGDDRAPLTLR